jgi:hypothetical protein
MGTRSIYLPDLLDRAARDADLDVTALARQAVEQELARRHNETLLKARGGGAPLGPSDEAVRQAVDEAKSDW